MKILIGVTEICGNIPMVADAFRKLGNQVTTVVMQKNAWWPVDYDFDFSEKTLSLEDAALIGHLISTHDVFYFQWARTSLLPGLADYPFIHKLGKKIISVFVGSDVRNYPAYKQWYGHARQYLDKIPFIEEPLISTLFPIRMAETFSSQILSQPNQSVIGVRPYMHFFLPMELCKYRFKIHTRDVPKIVHAPSKKWLKGTDVILNALETLKTEGIQFELRLLDGVPNDQVIDELIDADVLIDELYYPLHGKLSLEGLACGCAVVNGDREDYEPFPAQRPFLYTNPDNIIEQLRLLLTDKNKRIGLALEGAPYVKLYHDHVRVAQRVLNALDYPVACDHYPSFFSSQYHLPEGEAIPPELLLITARIIKEWGLPEETDLHQMVRRGLVSSDILANQHNIQRWSSEQCRSFDHFNFSRPRTLAI